tara:strand:+ start:180840 stop:181442 length:603 start_codon:yes stop_codon:yes gene_type:complete
VITIKKIILHLLNITFLFFIFSTVKAIPKDPVLIDYNISGSGQVPYFEPKNLELLAGQSYLFVIKNPFPDAINVIFGTMGQAIHTHYLEGVPGMSQSSMLVPAEGKVTWILDINKPGTYEVFAVNMGMGQKGLPSRIIVQPEGGNAQFTAAELAEFEKLNQQLRSAQNNPTATKEVPQSEKTSTKSKKPKRPRLMGGRPG